jgi:hypothetical protein
MAVAVAVEPHQAPQVQITLTQVITLLALVAVVQVQCNLEQSFQQEQALAQ